MKKVVFVMAIMLILGGCAHKSQSVRANIGKIRSRIRTPLQSALAQMERNGWKVFTDDDRLLSCKRKG